MFRQRPGFTLIELLVVITLMGALAALAILFLPSFSASNAESRGSQMLAQTLLIARQTALRDQTPTGVRFWYEQKDSAGQQVFVSDLEYVQQPIDYVGDPIFTDVTLAPNGFYNSSVLYFFGDDVTNGQPMNQLPGNQPLWNVQAGDFIDLLGSNQSHMIGSIIDESLATPSYNLAGILGGKTTVFKVTLNSSLNFKITASPDPTKDQKNQAIARNYRITRQPRSTGEDKISLPGNVVIDLSTSRQASFTPANPLFTLKPDPFTVSQPQGAQGFGDILFSPAGNVQLPRLSTQRMLLWVRNYDESEQVESTGIRFYKGSPSLVGVQLNSGLVSSYPVNPSYSTPYAAVTP